MYNITNCNLPLINMSHVLVMSYLIYTASNLAVYVNIICLIKKNTCWLFIYLEILYLTNIWHPHFNLIWFNTFEFCNTYKAEANSKHPPKCIHQIPLSAFKIPRYLPSPSLPSFLVCNLLYTLHSSANSNQEPTSVGFLCVFLGLTLTPHTH